MNKIRFASPCLYFTLVVFSLLVFGAQRVSFAHEPDARSVGHIVLGDSIECGVVFDPGSPVFGDGYVDPLHDELESRAGEEMDLVNLCVLGATSRDINLDQLPQAITEVFGHDSVVISYGGGGNNLRRFITSPQAATCARGKLSCLRRLNALLNEAEQNMRLAINRLRSIAGEDSQILMRTQYNALMGMSALGGPCADPGLILLANLAIEGGAPFLAEGLNDRIRRVAAEHGAVVAEIFGTFAANPGGLISGDCTHPTADGYAEILNAFIDVL